MSCNLRKVPPSCALGPLENGEIALRARSAIGGVAAEPWAPSSDQEQPGRVGARRWSQQSPQDHLTFPKSWPVDAPSSSQDLPGTLSPTTLPLCFPPLAASSPALDTSLPLSRCQDSGHPFLHTLRAATSGFACHGRSPSLQQAPSILGVTGTAPASGGCAPLQGAAVPEHMASSCTPHQCPHASRSRHQEAGHSR